MSTFGGGGGGGGPASPQTIPFVDSPSGATGVYSTTQVEMRGQANFIAAALVREWGNDPFGTIIGCGDPTVGAPNGKGWFIREFFGQLQFAVADGAGNNGQVGFGTSEWVGLADYRRGRDLLLLLRAFQSGGVLNVEAWVNGVRCGTAATAAAGMTPATSNFSIFDGGGLSTFGVAGYAFLNGTATDTQLLAFFEACYTAKAIVAGGITWSHLYTTAAGAPAATWADTAGSQNLALSGTGLVSATRAARWA